MENAFTNNIVVSVIIPLYKGKMYIDKQLNQCSEAFRNAGIENNSEIVLVNDYPNEKIDRTFLNNVRLIENKYNCGIQLSRINGLKSARGEWIHFLDQDDTIKPNFYTTQLKYSNKADVIVGNAIIKDCGYDRLLYRNGLECFLVKRPRAYIELDNRIISPGQCLIKREKIPVEWCSHIMKINGADDLLLWLLMFENNCTYCVNRLPIYVHEFTGQNLSADSDKMTRSMNELAEVYSESSKKKKYQVAIKKKIDFLNGDNNDFDSKMRGVVLFMRKLLISFIDRTKQRK